MQKINLNTIFKLMAIVLLVFLVILMNKCDNPFFSNTISKNQKEIINNDSIIESLNAKIEVYKTEKESLKKEREADKVEKQKLKYLLSEITEKYKAKKTIIKSFTNSDIELFYQNRYLLEESKTTNFGIELTENLARINIEDLTDCDETREKYDNINKTLKNTEKQLVSCDSVNALSEKEIKSLNEKNKLSESNFSLLNSDYIKEKESNSKENVFRLLGGFEYGNNTTLSNSILKANLSGQLRNGNIIGVGLDNAENIYVRYDFSIFSIKGKKK